MLCQRHMKKIIIDSISTCYYFCNVLIPLRLCNVCAMFVCIDIPNVQISFKSSKLQSLQVNVMLTFFFNTRYTHSSFNMCHFLPSGVYCNWREITLIRVILKSSK